MNIKEFDEIHIISTCWDKELLGDGRELLNHIFLRDPERVLWRTSLAHLHCELQLFSWFRSELFQRLVVHDQVSVFSKVNEFRRDLCVN